MEKTLAKQIRKETIEQLKNVHLLVHHQVMNVRKNVHVLFTANSSFTFETPTFDSSTSFDMQWYHIVI